MNTQPQNGELAARPFQWRKFPPHRILVVEDDGDVRRLNAEVLIHAGYRVDAAEDGSVAWESLKNEQYDLVVTDNEMPKVTGIELLKKMHEARMDMPVIMATGELPRAEFERNPWLQPSAILVKPYTTTEFLETVGNILDSSTDKKIDTVSKPDAKATSGSQEQLNLPMPDSKRG